MKTLAAAAIVLLGLGTSSHAVSLFKFEAMDTVNVIHTSGDIDIGDAFKLSLDLDADTPDLCPAILNTINQEFP